MVDRGGTEKEYNGYIWGSSPMYVALFMTLLIVLSSGYMVTPRYSVKAALDGGCYVEAQLSSKTIHCSFCGAVSSGESPTMNLIWRSFQEGCDRLREELDGMMDEEEAEKGEDGELKAGTFSLEEGMNAEKGMAIEEDTAVEEDMVAKEGIRWERYLYYALGSKGYVVRGEGAPGDSGVIDDDATEVSAADSPTATSATLTAQPLKSLATVHTWVVSGGHSFSLMAGIILDGGNGFVMITRKPYRPNGGDGPEVRVYLNGNGVYRYYEGN